MNNVILPQTTPQYLTSQIFTQYGFFTGTATAFQMEAAFSIAEWQVALEINTFLAPTTFTGTFSEDFSKIIRAPVGKLISINSITFYEAYTNGVDRLISGTARILDYDNGYFSIWPSPYDISACQGCGTVSLRGIYRADISITAGYASGTALTPNTLLASCMAADIAKEQMADRGMGQEFENFQTTTQVGRTIVTNLSKFIKETPFGVSSRAQYIRALLKPYKLYRVEKLG